MEETKARLDSALADLRSELLPTDTNSLSTSDSNILSRSFISLHSVANEKESNYALVIDGPTLNFATSPELEKRFLKICMNCQSVVCCRATPIQKVNLQFYTAINNSSTKILNISFIFILSNINYIIIGISKEKNTNRDFFSKKTKQQHRFWFC